MSRSRARLWLTGLIVIPLALFFLLYGLLQASLPRLQGEITSPHLGAAVRVERDDLGAVSVQGESRRDVAYATGYVHAQERFFQMDLFRRSAAGELSALVGPAALELDRARRIHGFRRAAEQTLGELKSDDRAVLAAYVEGVNHGLGDLTVRPWEYLMLRQSPVAWTAEDSLLVIYAMYFDLQGGTLARERMLGELAERVPPALLALLATPGGTWDAALDGSHVTPTPLPDAAALNIRELPPLSAARVAPGDDAVLPGSNSWVVGPGRSADGGAWLANDMHLGLQVPNTWFRLRLRWPGHDVVGVSLPGAPAVVVGSNGRLAWGFTNSYGDWADWIRVETDPARPDNYLADDGYRPLTYRTEIIKIAGEEDQTLAVPLTHWGPVLVEPGKPPLALRWTAHRPGGANLDLMGLETAADIDSAINIAQRAGIPTQNIMLADAAGGIAWTLAGPIPDRSRPPSPVPLRPEDGIAPWRGRLAADAYPVIRNPQRGFLWTANQRTLGGRWHDLLGDGGYALGARAAQIRDRLSGETKADPDALLAIALDDEARFLRRWRQLMLTRLPADATTPQRRALRAAVQGWADRAAIDDPGYRLVRAFRLYTRDRVLEAWLAPFVAERAELRLNLLRQFEGPLWQAVTGRQPHLLGSEYADWDALLDAAIDDVIARFWRQDSGFAHATWGERNTLDMGHPLGAFLPWSGWLDMPDQPLPGDTHMPRVQAPSEGASQRLVVSPGREAESYFHMPGGQSGHPLSPFYRAGHQQWVRGAASPLLPGPVRYVLMFRPGA